MASVGAELRVAGKLCGLELLSASLAWGHLEALCFLLPPGLCQSVWGMKKPVLPLHFMAFPFHQPLQRACLSGSRMWRSSSPSWTASLPSPQHQPWEPQSSRGSGGEFPARPLLTPLMRACCIQLTVPLPQQQTRGAGEDAGQGGARRAEPHLWGGHCARNCPEGPAQSGSSAPDLCFPERGGSWKVCPSALGPPCSPPASLLMSLSLQEGGEVQGFTVDLPSSLFMMVKEREEVVEHRVLLMDINRQTMFQVMPM